MSLLLNISVPNDGGQTFVHRFQNFGEDVYRALRDKCKVSIHEIDRATTSFDIREVKQKDIASIVAQVREIAAKHFFGDTLVISRE